MTTDSQLTQWLLDNAGPVIHCRTAIELESTFRMLKIKRLAQVRPA